MVSELVDCPNLREYCQWGILIQGERLETYMKSVAESMVIIKNNL